MYRKSEDGVGEEDHLHHGDTQVQKIAKSLHMASHAVALEFRMWKVGRPKGNNLSTFLDALSCLPVITAECDRGFSHMNLARTNIRNALIITGSLELLVCFL